jgi:hypothetical protein
VLAPLGVVLVAGDDMPSSVAALKVESAPGLPGWKKLTKPWPDDIDEWTHYLHGADGNAVARDRVVGPPKRLRWVAGFASANLHAAVATIRSQSGPRSLPVVARGGKPPRSSQ